MSSPEPNQAGKRRMRTQGLEFLYAGVVFAALGLVALHFFIGLIGYLGLVAIVIGACGIVAGLWQILTGSAAKGIGG